METPREYYTYTYLRKDGTPYYIGKGKGDRASKKNRKGIRPPKDKSRIIFLKQNLFEKEAFKHEIYMIAILGRKDLGTGILRNRTNGGEGSSGVVINKETREKLSNSHKGKIPWNRGKSTSKETRKKLSEANRGKNNPSYGKSRSKESRMKQSEARKGKYIGENNSYYGKKHSEETRKKLSEVNKGKNNPSYGKKWWHDGHGNYRKSIECPGEGWVPGRGKIKSPLQLVQPF